MSDVKIEIAALTQSAEAVLNNFRTRMLGSFQGLAAQLTAAFSVGAFVRFTQQAINTADEIERLRQKTGLSTESLSAWSYQASLADVEAGTLRLGMKNLAEEMVKQGKSGADLESELFRLADRFADMPDGVQKTALAVRLFGRSGAEMIPLLNQGSEALQRQREEAERYGLIVGPQFGKDADRFNDNLTRMKKQLEGLFLTLARDLLPELNIFLQWLVDFGRGGGNAAEIAKALAGAIRVVSDAALTLSSIVEGLASHFMTFWATDDIEAANTAIKEVIEQYQQAMLLRLQLREGSGDAAVGTPRTTGSGAASLADRVAGIRRGMEETRRAIEELQRNTTINPEERRRRILEYLQELQSFLSRIGQLESNALEAGELGISEISDSRLKRLRENLEILDQMEARGGFVVRMRAELRDLAEEWGNVGANLAGTVIRSIEDAVHGVGDAVVGLIDGTRTWGQVFAQVGKQIIGNLIQVVANWIAQMTIVRALKKIFSIEDKAEAASSAAAHAPGAALAATESYGAAAIIGAVALAAILALAVAGAAGAFAKGGRPPVGRLALVGERGPELFVPDTAGTILPNDVTNQFFQGGGGGSVNVSAPEVSVVFVRDEQELQRYLESSAGRKAVVKVVRDNRRDLGLRP